ncbi:hypothetical protein Acr_18g0007990 [Actinidia rufa]|uniref:Uncharacterized protein n=1 Tax=Actinidia rufa TaxID=165716 RepID=A0A7J0G779_9ERIC|nr:hypothetical protein Acr_18g0007990 [Actinidia rufa]
MVTVKTSTIVLDSVELLGMVYFRCLGVISNPILPRCGIDRIELFVLQMEQAVEVYHDEEYRSRKWLFPSYNFNISVIWSPFLAKAAIFEDYNGVYHLEEFEKAAAKASEKGMNLKFLDVMQLSLLRPNGHPELVASSPFATTNHHPQSPVCCSTANLCAASVQQRYQQPLLVLSQVQHLPLPVQPCPNPSLCCQTVTVQSRLRAVQHSHVDTNSPAQLHSTIQQLFYSN